MIPAQKEFSFDLTKVELDDKAHIGQEMYFYGFPQTIDHRMLFTKMKEGDFPTPFVKKAMLSAADSSVPNRKIFYFDGFNNHGFSGGPIAWFDGAKFPTWRVVAVVSAYVPSLENVVPVISSPRKGTQAPAPASISPGVLVNSGIVVGHSTESAASAIRKYAAGVK